MVTILTCACLLKCSAAAQGRTDESELTPRGSEQAVRARASLEQIAFDRWGL